MYSDEGTVHKVRLMEDGHGLVFYQIDTSDGQSGSGLQITGKDGHIHLVGVHTGYNSYDNLNIGCLITSKILDKFILPIIKKYNRRSKIRDEPTYEKKGCWCCKPAKDE